MRKLLALFVILAAFAWSQTAYGMERVIVYKGTIKASKSIFDVNDTNNYVPLSLQGYWAINVTDINDELKGMLISSSSVIYNPKIKYYKVIPNNWNLGVSVDPYDPCRIAMLNFSTLDTEGSFSFYTTGKGRPTKCSDDPAVKKDYIVPIFKGTGRIGNYDFFDPNDTYSGTVSVLLKLDTVRTRHINANIGDYNDIDSVTNDIVTQLTSKGGWTEWHSQYPIMSQTQE
jgi:hypothetical protein